MRRETRTKLHEQLALLRRRRRGAADRRNLLKVLRSEEMQDEFARRVRQELNLDVNKWRDMLKLFSEFATQVIKIIAQVVALFG